MSTKNQGYTRLLTILLLCMIGLSACKEVEVPAPVQPPDENQELRTFLDRFTDEAAARGVVVDFSNTDAIFVDNITFNGRPFCGLGRRATSAEGRNQIQISRQSGCWDSRSDLEKENLFFHEIGHAFFGRPHTDASLPFGFRRSIMCSATCDNFTTYNQDALHRRAYYINELIEPNTPTPSWAIPKSNFSTLWTDEIDENSRFNFQTSSPDIVGNIDDNSRINGSYSLGISTDINDPEAEASWRISLRTLDIPQHATVKLSALVTSNGPISGNGLAMTILTSDGVRDVHSSTTAVRRAIFGTLDRSLQEVNLVDYLSVGNEVTLVLNWLPGTTGEVYFDDIKLEVAED